MRTRKRDSQNDGAKARRAETLGVVLICLLILVYTLARFAKTVSWSLR
ncbi:MAG: hypothetical protein ABSD20_04100 [Terriglobales bacterium]